MSNKIDYLNDIYSVIEIAESANNILMDECAGNSNRYDWCKTHQIVIKRARSAYEKLRD